MIRLPPAVAMPSPPPPQPATKALSSETFNHIGGRVPFLKLIIDFSLQSLKLLGETRPTRAVPASECAVGLIPAHCAISGSPTNAWGEGEFPGLVSK